MAQDIALASVNKAIEDINHLREVTDRTSGKANQMVTIDARIEQIKIVEPGSWNTHGEDLHPYTPGICQRRWGCDT